MLDYSCTSINQPTVHTTLRQVAALKQADAEDEEEIKTLLEDVDIFRQTEAEDKEQIQALRAQLAACQGGAAGAEYGQRQHGGDTVAQIQIP